MEVKQPPWHWGGGRGSQHLCASPQLLLVQDPPSTGEQGWVCSPRRCCRISSSFRVMGQAGVEVGTYFCWSSVLIRSEVMSEHRFLFVFKGFLKVGSSLPVALSHLTSKLFLPLPTLTSVTSGYHQTQKQHLPGLLHQFPQMCKVQSL